MRTRSDPTFDAAVEAGLRACAVAAPEMTGSDSRPAAGIRPEVVQRCKALIQDGIYETEDRLDAAIDRLVRRMDAGAQAA